MTRVTVALVNINYNNYYSLIHQNLSVSRDRRQTVNDVRCSI